MQNKFHSFVRLTALLIFICIITAFLFSAFFISLEAEHDCDGEHCDTCEQIAVCAETLKKLQNIFFVFIFYSFLCMAISLYTVLSIYCSNRKAVTLVRLKVRMNN